MGTFSPVHWIITIALVAALGAFLYFIGSLLWAGAKQKGKGKLLAAAILLPLAVLALVGFMGATKPVEPQSPELVPFNGKLDGKWWEQDRPVSN